MTELILVTIKFLMITTAIRLFYLFSEFGVHALRHQGDTAS